MQRQTLKLFYHTSVVLFLILFISCSENQETEDSELAQTATVEAVEGRRGALPLVHRTTGEVRARNQVEIYPEINASITEIRVNDGDRVSEGDTLVRLRDTPVREQLNQAQHDYEIARAQLRQSQAELRRLQSQFSRVQELEERELEAAVEVETLQAEIDAAEASVDLARSQMQRAASEVEEQRSNLENTVVEAPVDGVVGSRNAEVGQWVDTSTRLFQIGDVDNMRVHVMLTEIMSNNIRPGDQAELSSSSIEDNPVDAVVERISPFLDPVTHTTIAQLEVTESTTDLRPGMFVTVDIFYGETDETTLIPQAAVYDHPVENETGIYVADMSAVERELELDEEVEGQEYQMTPNSVPVEFIPVEVLAEGRGIAGISGVNDSDIWVVTLGQHQLAEWNSDQAMVRMVDWDYVLELQNRQTRDMENIIFDENGND